MSEQKKDQKKKEQLPDWLSDFSMEDIRASASVDIKPKLEIDALGIEYAKDIKILSEIYEVSIPVEKSVDGSGTMLVIDLLYDNIEHQFIAEAGSFRFQLAVWKEKLKLNEWTDLIGQEFKLWKESKMLKTARFKGKAEVYVLAPIGKTKALLNK